METVNNLTSTASKLIWGDPKAAEGEEPRSGEAGDTSAGEPYDKGNEEPSSITDSTQATTSPLTGNTPVDNPSVETTASEHAPIPGTKEVPDVVAVDTSGAEPKSLSEEKVSAGVDTQVDSTGGNVVKSIDTKAGDGDVDAGKPNNATYKAPALTGAPVHQEGPAAASNKLDAKENVDSGPPSGSKLKGLKEKIKAKLHKKKD